MSLRAIGLVELNSVAAGIRAADEMLKAAEVELMMSRPVCPGRYLALVSGDTGSVNSAISVGREMGGEFLVDWFVIPHVHDSVFPAISCASRPLAMDALGVIETYSSASCIKASDAAAKAGSVELIEIRLATGLAGKSFVTMTGAVDSVKASVEAGLESLNGSGLALNSLVIPAPSRDLIPSLM